MNDGCCVWSGGRVIGGTSSINGMEHTRGTPKDYDSWGISGWKYADVLPYFTKSQDPDSESFVSVGESPYRTPMATAFLEAGKELGYEERNLSGNYSTGFQILQAATRDGRRCSTAKAYLRPAKNRTNLHFSLESHATKILIDSKTKETTGIEFERDGKLYRIKTTKEVIVAMGVINSPQLLLLSGIGAKDELTKHGITQIVNLPVGQNLQDHVGINGIYFKADVPSVWGDLSYSDIASFGKGGGTLTSPGAVEVTALIRTKYQSKYDEQPDIRLTFLSSAAATDDIRIAQGIQSEFNNEVFAAIRNQESWGVLVSLLHPASMGSIKLRSSNASDAPLIYANHFSNPNDLKILVEGVRTAIKLAETQPMKNINSTLAAIDYPMCQQHTLHSDEFYECLIRANTLSGQDIVGTCRMGLPYDRTSVVNDKLQVHGIKGLRVIDASIIPKIISANTNAASIMIGEKGAELIKAHWCGENKVDTSNATKPDTGLFGFELDFH